LFYTSPNRHPHCVVVDETDSPAKPTKRTRTRPPRACHVGEGDWSATDWPPRPADPRELASIIPIRGWHVVCLSCSKV